jgi:hypothetical protein
VDVTVKFWKAIAAVVTVVLYGFLTLRHKYGFKVFEISMLRGIFGRKRIEITA